MAVLCRAGGHTSGDGTSGRTAHWPAMVSARVPSAALTVKISSSSTLPMARAWLVWRPVTMATTSMSTTAGGRANERYCAVAHTVGRPVVRSMASTAAARPQPPKSAHAAEHALAHREAPAVGVVGRLEPEEVEAVHSASIRRGPFTWAFLVGLRGRAATSAHSKRHARNEAH